MSGKFLIKKSFAEKPVRFDVIGEEEDMESNPPKSPRSPSTPSKFLADWDIKSPTKKQNFVNDEKESKSPAEDYEFKPKKETESRFLKDLLEKSTIAEIVEKNFLLEKFSSLPPTKFTSSFVSAELYVFFLQSCFSSNNNMPQKIASVFADLPQSSHLLSNFSLQMNFVH